MTPVPGVFVFEIDGAHYKVKFVSYYNNDDERRYPTMLIASVNGSTFPALEDPELVSPAPCLLRAGDNDLTHWNASEVVGLREQGVNIRPMRSRRWRARPLTPRRCHSITLK